MSESGDIERNNTCPRCGSHDIQGPDYSEENKALPYFCLKCGCSFMSFKGGFTIIEDGTEEFKVKTKNE